MVAQGTGPASINASLARNLTVQPWTGAVSAEILGLGTLAGEPVVVRAAEAEAFLHLEGGTWVEPLEDAVPSASLGKGLADRLGLGPGQTVTLVGSYAPRIAFVRIGGIYRTTTPANDEVLVDEAMGRFLTAVPGDTFHVIRLEASDPAALLAFLEGFGSSVHVSGPGLPRADVHSGAPTDERLANLILRTGQGGSAPDYFATAIGEATTSVRVVAYGIAALLGLLVACGIHAVQARAFADRVQTIGVLRAVGATNGWMRRRLLAETLPFAFLAAVVGAGIGSLVAWLAQPHVGPVLFGHRVPLDFDPLGFAAIVIAVSAASLASVILLLRGAVRVRPVEALRDTPAVLPPESLEVVLRE